MPRPSAFNLNTATDMERKFHSTLANIYNANSQIIANNKKRKAEEQAIAPNISAKNKTTQDNKPQNRDITLLHEEPIKYSSHIEPFTKKEQNGVNSANSLGPSTTTSQTTRSNPITSNTLGRNSDKESPSKHNISTSDKNDNSSSPNNRLHADANDHTSLDQPMQVGKTDSNQTHITKGDIPKEIITNYPYILKVVDSEGNYLLSLEGDEDNHGTITASELYNKGIQWFEPNAIEYRTELHTNPDIISNSGIKHFKNEDIKAFADKYQNPLNYMSKNHVEIIESLLGFNSQSASDILSVIDPLNNSKLELPILGKGDWKKSPNGADGYLLSTIDGKLYWSDAIGQIPFAINSVRDLRKIPFLKRYPIAITEIIGKILGNGSASFDFENNYDNATITRTARQQLIEAKSINDKNQ